MSTQQPYYLVNLINGFTIDSQNQVVYDQSWDVPNVHSKYEPEFAVSYVAHAIKNRIGADIISDISAAPDKTSFSYRIQQTQLKTRVPAVYLLVQMVMLESVAHIYVLDNSDDLIQHVNYKDIDRVMNNLHYLADYFGFTPDTIDSDVVENPNNSIDYVKPSKSNTDIDHVYVDNSGTPFYSKNIMNAYASSNDDLSKVYLTQSDKYYNYLRYMMMPYENFTPFILDIRDLEVSFGYIRSQVDIVTGNVLLT